MNEKAAPTMADVAREAGVALGTVSKVVNGQAVTAEVLTDDMLHDGDQITVIM